ncbi:MAG: hypothetical protein KBA95_01895 [Acidobacteria bacterium]|nr:hypothetical protein [Acidobacteriota bacterium]
MALRLITPPAAEPVTTDQAAIEARVTAADDKTRLATYLKAARLDVEGLTGRALVTQTWELVLAGFDPIVWIPKPPLASVVSVTYRDPSGAAVVLAPAAYQLFAPSGETPGLGAIVPAGGGYWPVTASHPEAVVVRFTCGYGLAAAVPAPLALAVSIRAAQYYNGALDDDALLKVLARYVVTELA